MIGQPSVRTLVTNIGRGGRWVVVQVIEIEHGSFETRAEAEEFERVVASQQEQSQQQGEN